ncbi:MAG: hypothetical protein H6661_07060 [Ardenticatenaceae bacterium]|nr:hypothetical protein [Ardenticatenaceae bacterium]
MWPLAIAGVTSVSDADGHQSNQHPANTADSFNPNLSLRDFLQERESGSPMVGPA